MAEVTQDILTDADWNRIVDLIAEEGFEELEKEENQGTLRLMLNSLKQSASNFQKLYESSKQDIQAVQNSLTHQYNIMQEYANVQNARSETDVEAITSYAQMSIEQSTTQSLEQIESNLYLAAMDFQRKLNYFLGQRIQVVIVYEGGQLFSGSQLQADQLLHYSLDDGTVRGRYNTALENIKNAGLTQVDLQKYDQTKLARVLHGYNSSVWRYDYSLDHTGNHLVSEKGNPVALIMWRRPTNHRVWDGMRTINKGDLAEAYATIILSNHVDDFTSDVIEDILVMFMCQYVGKVDSTSGALQGDVSDKKNHIEYAIKAANNSGAGLKQFNDLANIVLKDNFSREALIAEQERLAEKGKKATHNEFIKDVKDSVDRNLSSRFEWFESNYKLHIPIML